MKEESNKGNLFWIYFTFISVMSMAYLGFWSFHNENIKGLAIAFLMMLLMVFTFIFSSGEVFKLKGSFRNNALWFFIGFIAWSFIVILGKQGQFSLLSTVAPERNVLLEEISAELPLFWDFFINDIANPFIEESFWLIGIPYAVIWMLNLLAEERKNLDFLKNKVIQLIVVAIVSGITFPLFHVRSFILPFIIGIFLFRSITIIMYWGDELLDILPDLKVLAALGIGMHMANNWVGATGLYNGFMILSSHPIGIVFIASFVMFFLGAVDYLINFGLSGLNSLTGMGAER